MANFTIFVVVLTIAYIIYYGYNISKDLYGKKAEKEPEVETFDVSDVVETCSTPVRESDNGFSVGTFDEPVVQEEQEEVASDGSKWKVKMFEAELEDADVQSEGGIDNWELEVMMLNKDPHLKFQPQIKMSRESY